MEKTYHNRYGSPFKIVEFYDSTHVLVEFQDEYGVQVKTVIQAVRTGNVKNPYDITCNGVGYLGYGKYKSQIDGVPGKHTKEYVAWRGILDRCYLENCKERYSAYYGICTVEDSWHNFQNFAQWYDKNQYECKGRLHVDKDILIKGNKIYSENTCLLVPQRINMIFMTYPRKHDVDLPQGINRLWHKDGKCRFQSMFNGKTIGTFDTLEEAQMQYLIKKREHLKIVAEEYRNIISLKVYEALLNW